MPIVGIVPGKTHPGVNTPDDEPSRARLGRLEMCEAMSREWDIDAYFVLYRPRAPHDAAPWHRINKGAVAALRRLDRDPVCWYLALDWDLPGHRAWEEGEWDSTLPEIAAVPLANQASYIYQTRHGFRVVYSLEIPVSPSDSEGLMRSLRAAWATSGFEMDDAAGEWNRLFALPQVTKGDENTFGLALLADPDQTFDPPAHSIYAIKAKKVTLSQITPEAAGPYPTAAEVYAILFDGDRPSEFFKAMRRKVKQSHPHEFDALFAETKSLVDDDRDVFLIRSLGGLHRHVVLHSGTGPEHLFALYFEAVGKLEPDSGTPDWYWELWRKVKYVWMREASAYEENQEWMAEAKAESTKTLIEVVREWAPGISREWLDQHMIVQQGKFFWVMGANGYYDPTPVDKDTVLRKIRELNMDHVLPTIEYNKDGSARLANVNQLLYNHAAQIKESRGAINVDGCFIKDEIFYERMYCRNPKVVAKFDPELDEHWRRCWGTDPDNFHNYDLFWKWVGFALWFEQGMPHSAMSIVGAPGIGKKLLVQGLAECVDTETYAGTADMGQYQHQLKHTPFLWLNEGLPDMRGIDPSLRFRELTGGDPIQVREMYRPAIYIKNPLRIIMTSNNDGLLKQVIGRKDLTLYDQRALAQRILTFQARDEAATYLSMRGGRTHTQGWIHSDAGQDSEYRMASQFMWYYERTREECKPDPRYLLEGLSDNRVVISMASMTGMAPLVIESVVSFLNAHQALGGDTIENEAVHVDADYTIWVTSYAIVDHFRNKLYQHTNSRLNGTHVANGLRTVWPEDKRSGKHTFRTWAGPGSYKDVRGTWHPIDPVKLLDAAEERGLPTGALLKLARAVPSTAEQLEKFEREGAME